MATGDVKDADASPADPEDVARLKVEVAANSRVSSGVEVERVRAVRTKVQCTELYPSLKCAKNK